MPDDDQDIIDGTIGDGAYDDWMRLQEERLKQELLYRSLTTKLGDLSNVAGIPGDFQQLQEVGDLYNEGMQAIIDGKTINEDEVNLATDLYNDAIALAEIDTDLMQMMFAAGFFDAITALIRFPYARLETNVRALRTALLQLKDQLEIAKRQRNESIIQGLIDVIVIVAVPELGFVLGAAKFFGKLALDDALGPDKGAVVEGANNSLEAFGTFAESAHRLKAVGTHGATVTKYAKVADKLGLAFDAYEVFKGYSNVNDIAAKMNEVKAELRPLLQLLDRYEPAVVNIKATVLTMRRRTAKNRADADEIKSSFLDTSTRAYQLNHGRWWRPVPTRAAGAR